MLNLHKPANFCRITVALAGVLSYLFITNYAVAAIETPNEQVLVLEAESLLGYSEIGGSSGDFSHYQGWLASWGIQTDDQSLWVLTYNGSYDESKIFVPQEEGGRETNQVMTNNFNASYSRDLNDNLTVRPFFFYDLVFVKETTDEDLGDGLYDYRDVGGGWEHTHQFGTTANRNRKLAYSAAIYSRQYPQFQSLLSTFDPNSTLEQDEKDYLGYKADISYEAPVWQELHGKLKYVALYKNFTDKRTINTNGIRDDDKREDFYQKLSGVLSQELVDNLFLHFETALELNISNLDFYDTRGTATLTDDRFFADYFDYFVYRLSPTFVWGFETHPNIQRKTQLQFGYALASTFYHGRTALTTLGQLTDSDQQDYEHSVFARATVPVTKELSWVVSASYAKNTSNQKLESFYRYNYETWSLLSGVSFDY